MGASTIVASAPLARWAATTAARSRSKRTSPFQRTTAPAPASSDLASRSAPAGPGDDRLARDRDLHARPPRAASLATRSISAGQVVRVHHRAARPGRAEPGQRELEEREPGHRDRGLGQEVGERPEPRAESSGQHHPDDVVHGRASLADVPRHATSPLLLRLLRLRRDLPPLLRARTCAGWASRASRSAPSQMIGPLVAVPAAIAWSTAADRLRAPGAGARVRDCLGLPRRAVPSRRPAPPSRWARSCSPTRWPTGRSCRSSTR